MAQQSSSGRGGTATAARNRSKSSGSMSASEIGQMTVDEIRARLRQRGVTGTSGLRKPDLVNALARAMRSDQRGGGGTAAGRRAPAAKKTTAAARKSTGGTRAGATTARTGTGPARGGTAAKRAAPAKRTSAAKKTGAAKKTTSARSRGGGQATKGPSRSLKYAQQINSPDERPERPGRSLVTRAHSVIQQWARDRQAKPATIEGTEKGDRPGVLTFNFPGWREGGRLRQITWDQWFKSFDVRKLNFIYQEQRSDGRQSNFFRVENPSREDA
ncbi:hypothetical protein AB0J86_29150 [Micromonospora sp. NPDC049559]|uniref:hypothetical protein n=1 Tax=Micromonospora sp. NPDC049559 TaxID=3155923 RepID=UPI00341B0BEE